METLSYRTDKRKVTLILIGMALIGVGATAGSVQLGSMVALGGSLLFFIVVGALGWVLWPHGPWLVIDDVGIHDHTMDGVGLILWEDIEDAYFSHMRGAKYLSVQVIEPDKYLKRYNAIKRWFSKHNSVVGFSEITIPLMSATSGQADEMMTRIKAQIERTGTEKGLVFHPSTMK